MSADEIDDPFAPTYGPRVVVEARYLVEPAPGGKRLQAGLLRLDSGEEWILSYRPAQDMLPFFEKRVVVEGRTYTPSPNVQHVMGTHFELESIALAPGESPHDPTPQTLPVPPLVSSLAALVARRWRWVHVQGILTALTPEPSSARWGSAVLQLDSGEQLELQGLRLSDEVRALQGQAVTAMGRVVAGHALGGRVKIRSGRVDSCLDAPRPRNRKARPGPIRPLPKIR